MVWLSVCWVVLPAWVIWLRSVTCGDAAAVVPLVAALSRGLVWAPTPGEGWVTV